jgi:hypothetical protein
MYLTCGCYDTEKHSASCSYAVSVLEYLTFSSSALTSSLNVPAKPVMTLLLYLCLILRVVRRIQYPPMTGLGLAGADGSASPTASLRSEDSLSARRFDLGACVVDCRSFNVVSRLERYDIGRHGCAVKRGEEGDTHARAAVDQLPEWGAPLEGRFGIWPRSLSRQVPTYSKAYRGAH